MVINRLENGWLVRTGYTEGSQIGPRMFVFESVSSLIAWMSANLPRWNVDDSNEQFANPRYRPMDQQARVSEAPSPTVYEDYVYHGRNGLSASQLAALQREQRGDWLAGVNPLPRTPQVRVDPPPTLDRGDGMILPDRGSSDEPTTPQSSEREG